MRNLIIVCLAVLNFLLFNLAYAAGDASKANALPASVRLALQNAKLPASAIGVYVQEVESKKPKLKHQEGKAFIAGSTIKLLTTNAALNLLGPGFTWKTQILGQGNLQGDTWHGDWIIKGSLDPKLVQENLWLLLRQLRSKGIVHLHGNIMLDRSVYPAVELEAGKFDGDPVRAYNVGPDALLLNFKSVRLYFKPDAARQQVQVTLDPPLPMFTVGPLKIAEGRCEELRDQLGLEFTAKRVQFLGTYPNQCGEQVWDVHPYSLNQDAYFTVLITNLWRELGGSISGSIGAGSALPSAPAFAPIVLAEWTSASLADTVRDINKYSNNVMARQLLLTLSIDGEQAASTERGVEKIKSWLAAQKIDAPELELENGSGLSRHEKIAPQSMARLLVAAYHSAVMPELISSLPVVAVDGTMRNRLKDSAIAGRAHIKTGTLNDVRAIAGYVLAASGKRYVVVGFVNHSRAKDGKAALDALLEWVHDKG